MAIIDGSIEIEGRSESAFKCWEDIERFPLFIDIVEEVKRLDSRRSQWRVNLGIRHEQWEAETTEFIPGKRIGWKSLTGSVNAGVVNFHDLPDETCLVTLHLVFEPKGFLESLGDEFGVVNRLVGRTLDHFREYAETVA